jgi:hypothetical protein
LLAIIPTITRQSKDLFGRPLIELGAVAVLAAVSMTAGFVMLAGLSG